MVIIKHNESEGIACTFKDNINRLRWGMATMGYSKDYRPEVPRFNPYVAHTAYSTKHTHMCTCRTL